MRNFALVLALAAGLATVPSAVAQPGPAEPAARPKVRYDGHKSVRVSVRTQRELMTVLALTDDVLTCEGAGVGDFDVRFTPAQFAAFLETGIPHRVLIEDIQAHLDAWHAENQRIRDLQAAAGGVGGVGGAGDSGGWYDVFRSLAEIEARLDELAAAHPTLAAIDTLGQSLEGRPIRRIRITGPGATTQRPAIVINGTQHSRESLSPMTTMWFLERLLGQYGNDPRITAAVNGIDFHFVPVVNPDGYEHVWTVEPMWRKNRRVVTGSGCMGVDLNRNWGYQWGNNNGSSSNPCTETYRGTAGFSEPETQAISSVINALGGEGRLKAHIDVHSYATQLLSPWGYTTASPPHLHTMEYLGRRMRDAIFPYRGTFYDHGPGSIVLYIVSGGSRDYTYGTYSAMGWTIELPGTSFHPPASEILPVAQETEAGFMALAEYFLPPAAVGACCTPDGCTVLSRAQCDAIIGVYGGDGSACSSPCTILTTGASNAGMTAAGGGIFLDLTAGSSDLEVTRFDYFHNQQATSQLTVEVWTYPGTYAGRDASMTGWTLHDTVNYPSGFGTTLRSPLELATPIPVAAGQTVGVYLVAHSGGIRYTSAGAQTNWTDGNLSVFSDRARSAPWGGNLFTVRTFAGSVYYTLAGGCYANCDGSTTAPILNVSDFTCFLNKFAASDPEANCDGSTTAPVLNVSDFICFQSAFATGCP